MDLNQLKEAGFNDQEIKEYVDKESKTLLNAGFNQQEVNQYFGIKEVDRTEIKSYWQNIKDEIEFWDNRVSVTQIRYIEDPDGNSIAIEIAFSIKGYNKIFKQEVAVRGEVG